MYFQASLPGGWPGSGATRTYACTRRTTVLPTADGDGTVPMPTTVHVPLPYPVGDQVPYQALDLPPPGEGSEVGLTLLGRSVLVAGELEFPMIASALFSPASASANA